MKKLTCHCGAVEAEVNVPDKFEKVLRCNCSVCKRKGPFFYIQNNCILKLFQTYLEH